MNEKTSSEKEFYSSELLLLQVYHYLCLGIDELFNSQQCLDRYYFLMILCKLLKRLLSDVKSSPASFECTERFYQAESLSRLAADVIFLEDIDGDRVNYLGLLRDLMTEARELHERAYS